MDKYEGTIVQYYGDGTLSTFGSAVLAVRSAIELQQLLRTDHSGAFAYWYSHW